ncbi:MAG: alpha/beta fold hydrolase [Burkholderiales bacterium]|nr:alpha/beta fold hydrolase [Burkholderiales bacterium]
MLTHLLYLHGFRSSPRSAKAQCMAAEVARLNEEGAGIHWWCPQLPPSPREAWALIEAGTRDWPQGTMAVVGSSLGGFYATVLAEHSGCRAVVINPAVFPARDLARYIGEQTSWHDPQDRFFFRPEFIAELDDLHPAALTRPERCFALIATGDEVLDWREMRDRYAACPMQIIEGSDHALSDFETWLPQVMRFIGG